MNPNVSSADVPASSEVPRQDLSRSVVRHFYALLATGNSRAALALLAPDVEWLEAERSPYHFGVLRGVEAIVAHVLEPINRDFTDFIARPRDFITEGEQVAALGTYSGIARISGRPLSAPFVHVWRVSDGRLNHFVQYTDSAAWSAALASG